MSRHTAFPFLVLPDELMGFRGWMIGDPGQPLIPATDVLEGWDYERDLEVTFTIDLDPVAAGNALSIASDELCLAVVMKAGTGSGTLPRRVERVASGRIDSANSTCTLSAVIPAWRLSGRLCLEAAVLLESGTGAELSPTIPGSRLWTNKKDILLEDGGESRFPIEVVSFSETFRGQGHEAAPWYVHWRAGNMYADFAGSVRVYVNSDDEQIAARFVAGDAPTLQAILGDVMLQMVSAALDIPDCRETLEDCGEGTVGRQILNWIEMAFPDQSIGSIRGSRDSTPGRFNAILHSAARVGE